MYTGTAKNTEHREKKNHDLGAFSLRQSKLADTGHGMHRGTAGAGSTLQPHLLGPGLSIIL